MKKIFFLLSMFFAFGVSTQAVPVRPGIKKVLTLADGTAVAAELKGDEYMAWWETADGRKFVQSESNEKTFVAADINAMRAQSAERRAIVDDARAKRMASARTPKKRTLGGDHITYTGKKKGIIILANFTDSKFDEKHDNQYYVNVANTPGFTSDEGYVGSVRDYFYAQSNGTFELDFDVIGPIELSHGYAWYGKDDTSTRDIRVGKMIKEAVEAADKAGADWKSYDWDGDGECDQVFVLYAGLGQASGGDANTIWPHEFKMSACPELNRTPVTTECGIVVDTYACSNENQPERTVHKRIPAGRYRHHLPRVLTLPRIPRHVRHQQPGQLRNGYMGSDVKRLIQRQRYDSCQLLRLGAHLRRMGRTNRARQGSDS